MFILRIAINKKIYIYPYKDKIDGKKEYDKVIDYLNPPNREYYKDIQYYKDYNIEVTLDWYDMGVHVNVGSVLK